MYKVRKTYKTYCVVERWAKKEKHTIGDFFVEKEKMCNTIEDTVKDLNKDGYLSGPGEQKVYAETAMPYTPKGYCYEAWIEKHAKFGMCLRLFGVNSFEGILVHTGNTAEQSAGCILVGNNTKVGYVSNSRVCLDKIIDKLLKKVEMKEKFAFYVIDRGDEI